MQTQVKYEIQELGKKAQSQLKKTDRVIASNELIAEKISEVGSALSSGFSAIDEGLRELCFNIDAGFREIGYKLDLLGHQLDLIREILEKPLDTQARELRKRGEFAYLNNWIDEAEIDLLEAEKKNYQDFLIHLMLGNIYFYHKYDFNKSLEYYQKAAKYAAPQSKKHASYALVCAAMVYYKGGRIADAYHSTKLALELLPQDWNAVYHHARYSAKMNYIDEFQKHLTQCIINDPNWLLTADNDLELFNVKDKIHEIALNLRDEKRCKVNKLIDKLVIVRKRAGELGVTDFGSINEAIKMRLIFINLIAILI
uniref:Tetratricopeptide repeat protein n=1 Tax=Desulfobacca acetoxidans TaxID=60893 RepID=A0A7V4G6Y1_9BACT